MTVFILIIFKTFKGFFSPFEAAHLNIGNGHGHYLTEFLKETAAAKIPVTVILQMNSVMRL